MKKEDFVHLHCHSTYSLLEALPHPEEIVLRAKELGCRACALTDKGYAYGLIEFTEAAVKHGMKPILGMEAYLAARTRHDKEHGVDSKRYPFILLAENSDGYQNLLTIATIASLEGMYYKPRVDWDLLHQYGKGLIALTGPVTGAIAVAALAEDGERITELTERFQSAFGKNNVYFELMDYPNVAGQAEVNQQLIHWGKKLGVSCVVTCDAHYCKPEDTGAHDILLCIQKNALIDDPHRFSMRDSDFSMRPLEELEKAFSHVPEALEATQSIAERCAVSFDFGTYHIPRFPLPPGETEDGALKKACEEGLRRRFGEPADHIRERLATELAIIRQMGFSGYFLIVADVVNEAKRRGVTVGPGRGSAAGSIASYSLNITNINPLEHGLIFERFLNPDRVTMPDIDIDFADNRRDEVLRYVREKYGEDRVVQICTFGTLAARAAVKDVGRAYGIPFLEMNELVKLIPERPGTTLTQALDGELKFAVETNETYRNIIEAAQKLEGKARHVSVHACGVIITPEPATRYTALQRAPKEEQIIITQYHAKPLEELGLLKMDFLGLSNLTVIQTTLAIVERMEGRTLDMEHIPLDDQKTYQLLSRGETTGVFQLESAGMRHYLQQLKPTTFNDITAMVSLYRPGPMEWITHYIRRKHGMEEIAYLHPNLKEIFEETYGIGVYQEQILELARQFAGFSLGEADILRRAIGKKIKKELDANRKKFIEGAIQKGNSRAMAEKIFDDVITPFAGYGFNKSHAACYARIAYETAYLKAHEPAAFMAALLSSDAQRTERILIEINECRAMGIAVLPPDINESLKHFTVVPAPSHSPKKEETGKEGKQWVIRFGLAAIKGIGEGSIETIIEEREKHGKFSSLEDFARRLPKKILNKKFLESLAKSGALDALEERGAILEHYESIVEYRKALGESLAGQTDLLSALGGAVSAPLALPKTAPISRQQMLQWEKETLGLYVSGHPLSGLKKYIGKKARLIEQCTQNDIGSSVTLAGIVESVKHMRTRKGEQMAVVTLEDPTGKINVTFFPRLFTQAASFLEKQDAVLVIRGMLDSRGGQLQVRSQAVKCASLQRMIDNAKKEGFFDEMDRQACLSGRQGFVPPRTTVSGDERRAIEAMDEEGDVIAGETITIPQKESEQIFLGTLSQWIREGMDIKEAMKELDLAI